ncbi:PEP-CTERM sorting domain-containing protein [Roseibacillus persicicus]|uniref:PEP-CTERM sorting domain-containing protein n=1 Tax=Roseibacillus persicicus TaxID=454148 RepID=UPI00280CCE19|nr:PEP-CTERM sorting domain-containing protein [Roseibacillus persicicus]MDQ8189943.1 PEP-CTERM sorting domain-containing protein [Roseibacillus persicicus]
MSGKILSLGLAAALLPSSGLGFNITLDFTYDDFFSNPANPYGSTGQAALQAAADEISSVLGNSLSAITTDLVSGSSGGGVAQVLTTYNLVDPRDGVSTIQRSPAGIGTNEIVIYVGARSMGAFTFAEASPGSPSVQIGLNSNANWPAALDNAEAVMNTMYGRGMTPLQRVANTLTHAEQTSSYELNFGPVMGSMWFNDSPADISDGRESWEVNNDYWHFDHTTPVGTGKLDIYSIALHEIIHVLGYGTGDNWNDFVSGMDWTGPEAIALLGTGEDTLHEDGYHIESGLESPGYQDGIMRQTVMNRSPLVGQRDQLTLLDLAFLKDSGYEIAVIPEPSTASLIALLGLAGIFFRRR